MENHFGKSNVFNLDPTALFADDIRSRLGTSNIAVGGPDAGANERADSIAHTLGAPRFAFQKKHTGINETTLTGFSGDVAGKVTITIDDMIDTGGTIENSQAALERFGARERHVYAAHPVFSKGGLEKLFIAKTADKKNYALSQLVVADTIDMDDKMASLKRQYGADEVNSRVRQLSIAGMLCSHIKNDIAKHPAMRPL